MKTTKSIVVVLFVLLAAQIASAFYCPSTGRWLNRDPLGESVASSLYEIVVNNPVSLLDGDGRQMFLGTPVEVGIGEGLGEGLGGGTTTGTSGGSGTTITVSGGGSGTTVAPLPIPPPVTIIPPQPSPNPRPAPSPSPTPQPNPTPNPFPPGSINGPPISICGCPACKPYPAGTMGYQGPDTGHTHWPSGDPHLHLFIVRQDPKTCSCHWNKNSKPNDSANPPPDPSWVNLGARGDPFPPFQ